MTNDDTLVGTSVGIVIVVAFLILIGKCVGFVNDKSCAAKCSPIQGREIENECNCKTPTGWEIKK